MPSEKSSRLRVAAKLVLTSPLTALLGFLVAMTFAINRERIGGTVSGAGLLPAPSGATTLLRSYLQEWHSIGGGTSAPAPALSGLLGLLGVPFGGADHAVAMLLLAAVPLAGISAYFATRASALSQAQRAVLAAMWALLPVGASASSYGRIDVVFTAVLLPAVLAGVASVLRGVPAASAGTDPRRSHWLSTTACTALGLAVLTTAAPLMYLLLVLVAVVGFVLVRPAAATGARRAASLFVVVLLPVGLLLPWPVVLLAHPSVLLHGVGSTGGLPSFAELHLVTLGDGVPAAAGALVVLIALLMLTTAPTVRMLPALAVVLLGAAATVGVAGTRRPHVADDMVLAGSPGPPLMLLAAGLLLILVVGLEQRAREPERERGHPWVITALALCVVATLGVGAVLGGAQGNVRAQAAPSLPSALYQQLTAANALVLTTAAGDQPARLSTPELPQLGDDDLVLTAAAIQRVAEWSDAITGGGTEAATAAVAAAAASGVGAVVLPRGSRVHGGTPAELLAAAGDTSDGRAVFRVTLPARGARVLEPGLAYNARTGGQPPGSSGTTAEVVRGTSPVPGSPPTVGVRVSAGPAGRLLVLAAEDENGWEVHVDGVAVAVAPAYGHLVGVALPAAASEVTVHRSATARSIALLVQAGLLVFTLLLAIPAGRGRRLSPRPPRPGPRPARPRGRWWPRPRRDT